MESPRIDRALPSVPEVEVALLASLMCAPAAWVKVGDLVTADLFTHEGHRQIYRVCRELWSAGHPVDVISVVTRLKLDGLLDSIGGVPFVSKIHSSFVGTGNGEYHARLLIQTHIQRRLIMIGHDAHESGYSTADSFDLLDRISSDITDLYALATPTTLPSASDQITDLTDGVSAKSYTFGIPELDALATFQAGLPHVFAGRPGIGKSIASVHIMWHLTQVGPVLLFSPEMTLRQVQARVVASECGVAYSTILRRSMDEQERTTVAQCIMRIGDRLQRLKIDPTSGITPAQMRARTERAVKADGVIAFGVDHLHKMATGDRRMDGEETKRVSFCMEGITEIAKNTNLPALVACQLNREVEKRDKKQPRLSDLKQTGKIEEDAALVVLLYRQGYYEEHPPMDDQMEFAVAKNRDGSTGLAKCKVTPAFNRLGETFTPKFDPMQGFKKDNDNAPF